MKKLALSALIICTCALPAFAQDKVTSKPSPGDEQTTRKDQCPQIDEVVPKPEESPAGTIATLKGMPLSEQYAGKEVVWRGKGVQVKSRMREIRTSGSVRDCNCIPHGQIMLHSANRKNGENRENKLNLKGI